MLLRNLHRKTMAESKKKEKKTANDNYLDASIIEFEVVDTVAR